MALEASEELSRLLREPGLLSYALGQLEQQTKTKRDHLVYGASGVLILLFALNFVAASVCDNVVQLVGLYGSLRALDKRDVVSLHKWTAFWAINAILALTDPFLSALNIYLRRVYLLKLIFLMWCAMPIQLNGATIVYGKLLHGQLFRPMSQRGSTGKKTEERVGDMTKEERRERKQQMATGGTGSPYTSGRTGSPLRAH